MGTLPNEYHWSRGRQEQFDTCKRSYYWGAYRMWGGWDKMAPLGKQRAYTLSKMTNIYGLAGTAIHNELATMARKCVETQAGELTEQYKQVMLDRHTHQALTTFRNTVDESERNWWQESCKMHPPLFETFYNQYGGIPDRTLPKLKEREQIITDSLANFTLGPLPDFLSTLLPKDIVASDEKDVFQKPVINGVPLMLRFDFAVYDHEKLLLFDWKSGNYNESDREQLLIYALAARALYELPMSSIKPTLYYLKTEYHPIELSFEEKELDEYAIGIAAKAAEHWALLEDVPRNIANPDRYPKINRGQTCEWCKWKALCYPQEFSWVWNCGIEGYSKF